MRLLNRILVKVGPLLALLSSIVVTMTTMYLNEGMSPIFMYLSSQVYLNWYCIYKISRNTSAMKISERVKSIAIPMIEEQNLRNVNNAYIQLPGNIKYWYCAKCSDYYYKTTHHCTPCNKCFHFRDHHCFFTGACIIRQNMGNFILICFHTWLACCYSLSTIGPYLYANFSKETSLFRTLLNFCFPVALVKSVIAGEDINFPLVAIFDTLFSVGCMCFIYGAWKLFLCLTGNQVYSPHFAKKHNLKEIFGSYGLCNVIFPYDGLAGTQDIEGYQLKQI